ncbi:MAG: type II toxin-antitoxin system prevent-host-death family antitoxin [Acidobacteria bacterium]|nr:type II toxin-antitoxin system prevent-host-death family antitoxin [Acidobacteriota bacterium]MBV9145165.1 type II toxin-antitoxin system prevent-host-death family antitoxin [Acidobacteriota bacterium]MBV9437001.1 type II toxin-antitoxin system prevent-host-death family antitoxin [Acidobacteriota bacterium]
MRRPTHKTSFGIKELKHRASDIIAFVQRTGQSVVITKNERTAARIVPVPMNAHERLILAGLLQPQCKPRPLSDLNLTSPAADASAAIAAIIRDRAGH